MKTKLLLFIAFTIVSASASEPPRPPFLPPVPSVAKPVATYSAADLLGVACTSSEAISVGHPFLLYVRDWLRLKVDWPGAQNSASIESLIQILVDAPEEEWSEDVWLNVQAIIRNVMAVDDNAKVTAVLRVVDGQSKPEKGHVALRCAKFLFDELLDTRLLRAMASELDEVTSYTPKYSPIEGMAPKTRTYRWYARYSILDKLKGTLRMDIDKDAFRLAEEAAGCAALKDWLNAHWAEIEAKCAEKKADPNRRLPPLVLTSWGL